MDKEIKKNIREVGGLMTLGLEMGISVTLGYFMGTWIDNWLGTQPIFLILCILFGFGAAFLAVYRAYKIAKDIDNQGEINGTGSSR
jgi:ATP synthase protein I